MQEGIFSQPYLIMQQDIITSIAIFYIILYSHFNVELLGCYQKNLINNNTFIKYGLGFICLFFLVTLFSKTGQMSYVPPIQKLIHTFVYYIIFLLSLRLDYRVSGLAICLILFTYFLELNVNFFEQRIQEHNTNPSKEPEALYNKYNHWLTLDYPVKVNLFPVTKQQLTALTYLDSILFYIIIGILIFGFICYGGEIKDKLKGNKSLTWLKVITDTNDCKIKDAKPLLYYFKQGLGIKL